MNKKENTLTGKNCIVCGKLNCEYDFETEQNTKHYGGLILEAVGTLIIGGIICTIIYSIFIIGAYIHKIPVPIFPTFIILGISMGCVIIGLILNKIIEKIRGY